MNIQNEIIIGVVAYIVVAVVIFQIEKRLCAKWEWAHRISLYFMTMATINILIGLVAQMMTAALMMKR